MISEKPEKEKSDEIEVTAEMIEAGEEVVLTETMGAGATLAGTFSSSSLAARVFAAMWSVHLASRRFRVESSSD